MEALLAETHERAAYNECLAELLELYGAELHGFLRARCNDGDVDELYGVVSAALVEALPRFERRSSFRTWMYQVARFTVSRAARMRRPEHIPLSQVSHPSRLAMRTSEPPSHLGDEVLARLAALRAELEEEDRELLYLRIDRELEWRDIAEMLGDGGEAEEVLARRTAALRKRFERLKVRIRSALS
jgi:RNA polymerase sigma factor (sigma-70 family)